MNWASMVSFSPEMQTASPDLQQLPLIKILLTCINITPILQPVRLMEDSKILYMLYLKP